MEQEIAAAKEKIKEYILQSASAEKDKIEDHTLIFKDGFFDSMGFVMLITFLEQEFGIKTVDSDLVEENFESINAITGFVARKTQ
jgi:acyl carrier protein